MSAGCWPLQQADGEMDSRVQAICWEKDLQKENSAEEGWARKFFRLVLI